MTIGLFLLLLFYFRPFSIVSFWSRCPLVEPILFLVGYSYNDE